MDPLIAESLKELAPGVVWLLIAGLLVLVALRVRTTGWKMPAWFRQTAERSAWVALGAILVLFVLWCRRQYGKEVAFRMHTRAIVEKPADLEAVSRLFEGAKVMVIPGGGDHNVFRYRFCGSEDLDVVCDKSNRVISVNPTYTQDGFGLTLLLHRRELSAVAVSIPDK